MIDAPASGATPRFELATVTAAMLPAVTQSTLPVPIRQSFWSRDTLVHGALSVGSVTGIGTLLYVAGTTPALVAAALAAAVATGIGAARYLVGGQRHLTAALDEERRALVQARGLLGQQLTSLGGDRERLDKEFGRLDADRAQLAAERQGLAQQVASEVQRVLEPRERALAADREVLTNQLTALETRHDAGRAALEAEANGLSDDQLKAITTAAEAYNKHEKTGIRHRFVAQIYSGANPTLGADRMVASDLVLATLVTTGKVIAGPVIEGPDQKWVVTREAATTITSIAQLRTFLRLTTGQAV